MSTATLLIVTARLRGLARADGYRDPALFAPSCGRSRVTRERAAWLILFRRDTAGQPAPRALPARRPLRPHPHAGARLPLPRARVLVAACLFALIGSAGTTTIVHAQTAAPEDHADVTLPPVRVEGETASRDGRMIGGKAPQGPCVIVEIAGTRAGHLDCATQKLTEAARSAQTQARAGYDVPVPQAGSPDVQLGVANQTATRLRMGSAFGNSVHSERPVTRPPRAPRP